MSIEADGEKLPPLTTLRPLTAAARDALLAALDGPPPEPTDSLKRAIAAAQARPIVLTEQEAVTFLEAIDNPPPPNEALKRLMAGVTLPG